MDEKNVHLGSEEMRNGEKRAERFLGQFFRVLKYVIFCFRTIKPKRIGTIAPSYKCLLFSGGVHL